MWAGPEAERGSCSRVTSNVSGALIRALSARSDRTTAGSGWLRPGAASAIARATKPPNQWPSSSARCWPIGTTGDGRPGRPGRPRSRRPSRLAASGLPLANGAREREKVAEAMPPWDRPADLGHVKVKRLEGHPGGGGETLAEGGRKQQHSHLSALTLTPRSVTGIANDATQSYFQMSERVKAGLIVLVKLGESTYAGTVNNIRNGTDTRHTARHEQSHGGRARGSPPERRRTRSRRSPTRSRSAPT